MNDAPPHHHHHHHHHPPPPLPSPPGAIDACLTWQENRELQHEISAFNDMFNIYIAKAEARVQSNPGLAQVRAVHRDRESSKVPSAAVCKERAETVVVNAPGMETDGDMPVASDAVLASD